MGRERNSLSCPFLFYYSIQGKDTVDFSLADADYKVVTYIDSVGCTSCKLQLLRWKLFMQEVDSTLNRPVPFVFYFHPKDMKDCVILPVVMHLSILFVSMKRTILTD